MKVSNDYVSTHGISPDGRLVAVRLVQTATGKSVQAILDAETGKVVKTFTLPLSASQQLIEWMPDGKSLCYVNAKANVENIDVISLETLKQYQLTHFDSGIIGNFAWSKDGKELAIVRGEMTRDIVLLTDTK